MDYMVMVGYLHKTFILQLIEWKITYRANKDIYFLQFLGGDNE